MRFENQHDPTRVKAAPNESNLRDLFYWTLSPDEQWYIGKAESITIRLVRVAGFYTWSPTIEILQPCNIWTPIDGRVLKMKERLALWREARYSLIIRHDLGRPGEDQLFDAFLSYASEDADLAERVAISLRSYGFRIWYDKWCLPVSPTMPLEYYFRYGIKRSAVLIRLMFDYGPLVGLGGKDFGPAYSHPGRWSACEKEILTFTNGGNLIQFRTPRQVLRSLDDSGLMDCSSINDAERNSILDSLCNYDEMIASLTTNLKAVNYESIQNRVWFDEDPLEYTTSCSPSLQRLAKGACQSLP